MGESLTGITGVSERAVVDSLEAFYRAQGAVLRPALDDESPTFLIESSEQGQLTIYGWVHVDEQVAATRYLSEVLSAAVFHIQLHDRGPWSYTLYASGQEVDRFSTIPDHWGELPDEQMNAWRGRAAVVCEHWPVREERIENYLVWWRGLDAEHKAYPDDESSISSEGEQLYDFIERLGLVLREEEEEARYWIVDRAVPPPVTTRMDLAQLVEALIERPEKSERDQVVSILRAKDEQTAAHARLCEMLATGEEESGMNAVRAIAHLGLEQAVEDLLPHLEQENDWIRVMVATALLSLGEQERAMPVIEAALRDETDEVRHMVAAVAIGHHCDRSQLPLLERAAERHAPLLDGLLELAIERLRDEGG